MKVCLRDQPIFWPDRIKNSIRYLLCLSVNKRILIAMKTRPKSSFLMARHSNSNYSSHSNSANKNCRLLNYQGATLGAGYPR